MKKKTILWILAGVVVLLLVVAIVKGGGRGGEIRITTEQVSTRTIIETVSANGKVQPEVEVKIGADVSGEIVNITVQEGQKVKEGELLVEIDPDLYQSGLDRAQAAVNTSQANLANSKARLAQTEAQLINMEASFKRNEKLHKQGAISDSEFDAAKSSYEVSKSEREAAIQSVKASEFTVKNSEASLKEAQENLRRTSIYAPVEGTVYGLAKEKGERVAGTSQFSEGTEIFRIADLHNMEVNVEVNENDIVRVNLDDTADIEVDAYIDRTFKGVVTEIANSANTTGLSVDQVTTFNVKIRILRSSYEDLVDSDKPHLSPFRPGMSATVEVRTARAIDVLAVPIQSVTVRIDTSLQKEFDDLSEDEESDKEEVDDEELFECVFLYWDGKVRQVSVKTGVQDNKYIEIIDGVKLEDEIVSGPYTVISKDLKHNDEVDKVEKHELFTFEEE